jgi:L-iditol 2-dehydrogenase
MDPTPYVPPCPAAAGAATVRPMRAAILHGQADLRVEEVAERPLAAGEVRLRVEAALTCGTDLKVYRRGYHEKMLRPPSPFGHEAAGVISEIGPGVEGWLAGDRAVVANSAPCGLCRACRRSKPNLCDDLLFLNGAYAASMIVPERIVRKNLVRLAEGTAFVDAALTEPLACVVQGLDDLAPQAGDKLLVLGAGPIGLMAAALGRALGCEVIVAGRGEGRLAAALRLGASEVVDMTGREELEPAVRGRFPKADFDAVFEAVGKPSAWEAAARLVAKGGRVNFFGGCPRGTSATFDTGALHYSALTFLGSFHHTPGAIRRALAWIERGVVRSADFVDGSAPLSALPELFASMAAGNRAVKTRIDPRG